MSDTVWVFEEIDYGNFAGENYRIAIFKEKPNLQKLLACFPLYEGQDRLDFPSDDILQKVLSKGGANSVNRGKICLLTEVKLK